MPFFLVCLFLTNVTKDLSILLEQIYNIRKQDREIIYVCVKEGKLKHFQTILVTLAFTLTETRRQWRLQKEAMEAYQTALL